MHPKRHYSHLSADERDEIAMLKAQGLSRRKIGERLGRNHSTIDRELKRNHGLRGYRPAQAHRLACARQAAARQRPRLKTPELRAHVEAQLALKCTPERIAAGLRRAHPGCWPETISAEAIYQYVYSNEASPQLREQLRRRRRARGLNDGRGRKKLKIVGRTPISERPQAVDERREFGHWEGDTIVSKGRQGGLHTELERLSRYFVAVKIDDLKAPATLAAQRQIFAPLPKRARRSTTLDNGSENAEHLGLRRLSMRTYFADPYAAWQRGANENANGLLRRFYPKGTDFSRVEQSELDAVVKQINDWPRECLGWASAAEEFARLRKAGVAAGASGALRG